VSGELPPQEREQLIRVIGVDPVATRDAVEVHAPGAPFSFFHVATGRGA
jgi:hypothetical protein